MGLDMYLNRHHYYGGCYKDDNHENDYYKHTLEIGGPFAKKNGITKNNVNEVIVKQAYWRKANAIHGWFVRNVQDGNDDCKDYYVTKEKLDDLRDLCIEVLEYLDDENYDKAIELLPPSEGFFFGQYDVKHPWYREEIKETIEMLNDIPEETYCDSSSW